MKIFKTIGIVVLAIIVIAQFFGPEKNSGEVKSIESFLTETNPPEEVVSILKTACFDCHTNTTKYPWYSNITPINYWMDDHIKHGKDELNFANWTEFSLKKKEHKMEEVWEEVEKNKMPLEEYLWTHSDAKLNESQKQALISWAKNVQLQYKEQINTQQ